MTHHDHNHDDSHNHNHDHNHDHDGSLSRSQIAQLLAGSALFLGGLILQPQGTLRLAVFLSSYVILGHGVVWHAVKAALRRDVFNEYFLMSIATIGAFLIGEYPEGVAVMLFYLVGETLQGVAVGRSRRSIGALMAIRPEYANVLRDGGVQKVEPQEVHIGDSILVKPGERIPLDGHVTEGTSMADTSALTGESVPRLLEPGSDVLSGFINMNGALTVAVERDYEHSAVSKILELVEHAANRKAPAEQFISRFARVYTPAVVLAAALLAFVPPLVLPGAVLSEWVYRALVLLVISCPCALVISIPLSFFGGIGGASRQGILIKGSSYLEALTNVDAVVFDKTGTLTQGVFRVTQIAAADGWSDEDVLAYAAHAESQSNHPVGRAVIARYGKEIEHERVESYEEIAGHGVRVRVDGREVLAGNEKWMRSNEVVLPVSNSVGTSVYVAVDRVFAGRIDVSDALKEDASRAIRELRELGIRRIAMLTGDTQTAAQRVAAELGIHEVHAGLLPEEKVELMETMASGDSSAGRTVFVGDGINDAPVLARADIGIAMGGLGSDAAIEASDVVLMTDEVSKVPLAVRIARHTQKIVTQNLWFVLIVKGLFLILGAMGAASMWGAVFADVGVTVLVVLNSIRAMRFKNRAAGAQQR
jgi:Cd2+/Zn2+-exporting ATPase